MKPNQHLKSMVSAVMSEIKQKLEDFCKDREDEALTPNVAAEISKSLQEATLCAAREGYRTFIESYDTDVLTIQINGTTYRRKLPSPKPVMSPFGLMKVTRHLYQPDRGGKTHVPLDAMWGMEGEYATPEVREACLFTLAHVTAHETASILKKCASFHPSATAIQHMAEKVGTFVEVHEKELSTAVRKEEEAPSETQALVASMDGVNVLLNEPGPRQGRPKERPSSSIREEKTSYRNAMVGSLSLYGEVLPEEHTPERLESHYIATMPEEKAPTFKQRFEEELKHAESLLGSGITKMFLCDGHKGIWTYADSNPLYDEYVKGVDFYHTSEHLSRAAEALFGKSSPEATTWYESWYDNLLKSDDAAFALIRSIDYYRKTRNFTKRQKKEIRKERTFFLRNKHRMKYAEFLRRGLPIGSGPVEAACKTIVKTRMCRSGMRWSRKGGQHILHLRSFVKSNRWDAFWNNYLQLKKAA
jgi:hypothetical protein